MLIVGMIFLVLTGFFGIILLNAILNNKKAPKPVVFLHGAVALFAMLVLLGYIIAGNTEPLLIAALGILGITALGGLAMLVMGIRKTNIPKLVVLIHPLLGISGFVILIYYLLS